MTFPQPLLSPRQPLSFRGVPERREKQQKEIERKFEYRNASGEKICDVQIRLSSDLENIGLNRKGRKVLEYKMKGVDSGKGGEVDLLVVARSKELNIPMYVVEVTEGAEAINSYSPDKKRVTVTLGGTLLDAVTILHEFGHAEQDQDPRFAILNELSILDTKRQNGEYIPFERIQLLKESLDVVFSDEEVDDIREYGQLEREAIVLQNQRVIYEKRKKQMIDEDEEVDFRVSLEKLKQLDELMASIQKKIDETLVRRKELMVTLKNVIRLPKTITERDATARAFSKMRSVRSKNNIDLFSPVVLADTERGQNYESWKRYTGPHADCLETVRKETPSVGVGEVSDAQTYFTQYALWTYYGRTSELMKRYGSVPRPKEIIDIDEIEEVDLEDINANSSLTTSAKKGPPPIPEIKRKSPPPIPLSKKPPSSPPSFQPFL